jgi:hypothetical protein
VWEVTAGGNFHFYNFQPGSPGKNFTPYIGLGIGFFAFDPYTYINGEKVFLQPIGTEGQGSIAYPQLKKYKNIAMCFPLSIGLKWAITERSNFFVEFAYRFTNTDFIDDVSGNYAPDAFSLDAYGNPPIGYFLQDRSYETGNSMGIKGRQRGQSTQPDSYATLQAGITFNLLRYTCPKY